jgi:hypothetical protein
MQVLLELLLLREVQDLQLQQHHQALLELLQMLALLGQLQLRLLLEQPVRLQTQAVQGLLFLQVQQVQLLMLVLLVLL